MIKTVIKRVPLFVILLLAAAQSQAEIDRKAYFKSILKGKTAVVRQYLKQGASVNKPFRGHRPLHAAAAKGHNDIVRLLLKHGADIEGRSVMGITPLQYAALFGRTTTIKLLLKKGADIRARHPKGGSALHAAASQGYVESVKVLLAHGAKVNDNANVYRETPLHAAIKKNYMDVAKLLIANGAKPNIRDRYGWTPLDLAERYGLKEMSVFLRRQGGKEAYADISGDNHRAANIPQANPVHQLLKSVKQNKIDLFKDCFSRKFANLYRNYGWEKSFQSYKKIYQSLYGSYQLKDFRYLFRGNEEKGVVFFEFRGRKSGKFRVVKEGGSWRLNNR